MVTSVGHVHVQNHVPLISLGARRQLVAEVNAHGPGPVFDNRASRAEIFRQKGDEESAQEAEKEAGYLLDVFA